MATAIQFPNRPLSSRAVFRDLASHSGICAVPKSTRQRYEAEPALVVFPANMPTGIRENATRFLKSAAEGFSQKSAAYAGWVRESRDAQTQHQRAYPYINLLAIGPVQFLPDRPFPGKELRKREAAGHSPSPAIFAGEWTMMCAFEWNNPCTAPGGGLPATRVLGDRPWKLHFEIMDRTRLVAAGRKTFSGVFAKTAPEVLVRAWFFLAPDPGESPARYEAIATFTTSVGGYALGKFGTWQGAWQTDPDAVYPIQNRSAGTSPGTARSLPESMHYFVLPGFRE